MIAGILAMMQRARMILRKPSGREMKRIMVTNEVSLGAATSLGGHLLLLLIIIVIMSRVFQWTVFSLAFKTTRNFRIRNHPPLLPVVTSNIFTVIPWMGA